MNNRELKGLERIAFKATHSIGSTTSIVLHTLLFVGIFVLHPLFGWTFDKILLVLTTAVSLEAIYLAIFIQMSVNMNTARLSEVSHDVEEIQEDVQEINTEVSDLEKDIEELSHDVEEITEEMEEDEREADKKRTENRAAIEKVEQVVVRLLKNLENLKDKNDHSN